MDIIQQIAVKAVEEIFESVKITGLNDIGKTIKALTPVVSRTVLSVLRTFLEEMDEALVNGAKTLRREDGITVKERGVPRTWLTEMGELTYKRTYFRLQDGSFVYLLDHIIGVESYERISKELVADILQAATVKSYQQAIDSTKQEISRQTVHNRLVALDDLVMPVERVKDTPETLDVFADEDHVHLTPKGQAIVPLVTITEGMDVSNPKRHKVKNPLYIAGYRQSPSAIYNQAYATADRMFDLDNTERIYVHGDGGSWIKAYRDVFPDAVFVMDEFHITSRFKELSSFFSKEDLAMLMKFIRENNRRAFYEKMTEAIKKEKPGKQAAKLREQLQYFVLNWDAIVRRKTLDVCGSCTEPMISHVLAERISRTPCCWSEAGLEKMAMLRAFKANGGVVKRNDINVSADKKAVQKGLKKRKEEGYDKYVKYAQESAEELEKRFRETFHNGLADYVIDVSGGVQQFIKRISSQELGS